MLSSCTYKMIFCFLLFSFGASAQAQDANTPTKAFRDFYMSFTGSLKSNDPAKIARFVQFPLALGGKSIQKEAFLQNKGGSTNIFATDDALRKRLIDNSLNETSAYSGKSELLEAHPACKGVPESETFIEIDTESSHGGPAWIFVFAQQKDTFKLVCIDR